MHEASIIYPLVRESHIEPFNAVYNGVVAVVLDGGSLGDCHQHLTVRPGSVTNIQASTSGHGVSACHSLIERPSDTLRLDLGDGNGLNRFGLCESHGFVVGYIGEVSVLLPHTGVVPVLLPDVFPYPVQIPGKKRNASCRYYLV